MGEACRKPAQSFENLYWLDPGSGATSHSPRRNVPASGVTSVGTAEWAKGLRQRVAASPGSSRVRTHADPGLRIRWDSGPPYLSGPISRSYSASGRP